ncbi:MAG: DUF1353 domain-containing protein [Planctomycetaceae bacterium]|nr:DUF1353 domain-containing protein [Planctomycetaceae bacterium]
MRRDHKCGCRKLTVHDVPFALLAKMEGPTPDPAFECDGCTCVANFLFAVDCRPACLYHDWSYKLGGDRWDRIEADRRFYRNMRSCDVGKFVATVRYLGVRACGWMFFNWKPQ